MKMDLALAELVLAIHLLFILWVMAGALLVRHYPALKWFHIGSLIYGIFIEVAPWPPCPLTMLEQWLEGRAGEAAYHGPFLLHYLDALVYPNLPLDLLISVAVAFCVGNLIFYAGQLRRPCGSQSPRRHGAAAAQHSGHSTPE